MDKCIIVLPVEASKWALTPDDVYSMLKACDMHERQQYRPTYIELKALVKKAYQLESQRNRIVLKWLSLVSSINNQQ